MAPTRTSRDGRSRPKSRATSKKGPPAKAKRQAKEASPEDSPQPTTAAAQEQATPSPVAGADEKKSKKWRRNQGGHPAQGTPPSRGRPAHTRHQFRGGRSGGK